MVRTTGTPSRATAILQAAYSIENDKTSQREVQGLSACAKEFGLKSGTIITWDVERVENASGIKVRFVPLWKWLLDSRVPADKNK